jgi:hypothetical protein
MDVLIQKEEADNLRAACKSATLASGNLASGSETSILSTAQLSPSEVLNINRQATEAFHNIAATVDTTRYNQLMKQLHDQGLISKVRSIEQTRSAIINDDDGPGA